MNCVLPVIFLIFTVLGHYAHAQDTTHKLFAIDLSLDNAHKDTAYDIIKEALQNAGTEDISGLTLFDDTIRAFIKPEILTPEHHSNLFDVMDQSRLPVRATSNLAVGIERAIDNLSLATKGHLIVFSRGVIDTATEDPRARFTQWLTLILMPQAETQNIAITMVVPRGSNIDPAIANALNSTAMHQIFYFEAGHTIPVELANLLDIQNHSFGHSSIVAASHEAVSNASVSTTTPESPIVAESLTQSKFSSLNLPLLVSLFVLAMAFVVITAVLLIAYRRNRATAQAHNNTHTTGTSTYLPLNEPPEKSMDSWMSDMANSSNTPAEQNNETAQSDDLIDEDKTKTAPWVP